MKKLEYVDIKNAIDNLKREIEQAEITSQLLNFSLKALEKELKNHKPPKLPDEKGQEPFTS